MAKQGSVLPELYAEGFVGVLRLEVTVELNLEWVMTLKGEAIVNTVLSTPYYLSKNLNLNLSTERERERKRRNNAW